MPKNQDSNQPDQAAAAAETTPDKSNMPESKDATTAIESANQTETNDQQTAKPEKAASPKPEKSNYGSGWTKWILVYVVIAVLVYGAYYYFAVARAGSAY